MKKVVAIILRDKDNILLQLRDNIPSISYPNYWTVPSGSVEQNESELEAVMRECKEETGYVLKSPKKINIGYQNENGTKVETVFFDEKYDNKQKIKCFEGQKMEFKNKDEIVKLKLVPVVKEALGI